MQSPMILFSSLTLTACALDDATAPPGQLTYTRTIVRTSLDGSQTVTQEVVTAAQQDAEALRAELDLADRTAGTRVANATATTDCSNFSRQPSCSIRRTTLATSCASSSAYEAQVTPTTCDLQAFDIGINEFKL